MFGQRYSSRLQRAHLRLVLKHHCCRIFSQSSTQFSIGHEGLVMSLIEGPAAADCSGLRQVLHSISTSGLPSSEAVLLTRIVDIDKYRKLLEKTQSYNLTEWVTETQQLLRRISKRFANNPGQLQQLTSDVQRGSSLGLGL